MKFTCENCGAQYLIADSKLGDRGVKVRCKKCSYVIILRPAGWSPDQKREGKDDAPPSADLIDSSQPTERPPNVAYRDTKERDAIVELPSFPTGDFSNEIAVAPDLGLSQEFAALGFQEEGRLDSDLASSPFTLRHSGGSLDDVPGFGLDARAGDHVSFRPDSDATDVLDRRTAKKKNGLGGTVPDIEDDRAGDSTHVDHMSISDEDEDTPLEQDGGTGELNDALARMQRNELSDMRSSLELDLEGLSSALDPRELKKAEALAAAAAKPVVRAAQHKPNFQALNALATESDGSPAEPEYNIADQVRAEREIGSAFEQMFGEGPTDDGMGEIVAPQDKLPTRVFNAEAMQQVESEQAIARPAPSVDASKEWYVAIDDQQIGPLSIPEVRARWEDGELGADSLCWKQGLGDWQPMRLMAELRVHLGPMEDRERTVVSEEDSLTGGAVPPQLSIHPDPEPMGREHSMSAGGTGSLGGEAAMDEPSWRPSAASALASLAAEELGSGASAIAAKNTDVAVGAAMPATSDALERLLAGDGRMAAATQFGAAEKSESSLRPLPRRAEAMTSAPLRDPGQNRSRSSLMLPLSIVGAALIVVVGVVWTLSREGKPADGKTQVAMTQPPAAPPVTAPPVAPPAAGAVTGAVTPPPAGAPPPPEAVAGDPPPASDAVAAKSEEKGEDEEDGEDKEAKKKRKGKKKGTEKSLPKPTRERRETVDEGEVVAAPPPTRRGGGESDVDDLLAPGERRELPPSKRESIEQPNDVPRQLDDSDILGVLRKNRKAIIDCVKKQQTADGSVSGTMMVNMVITKAGQTTRITVSPDRYTKTVAGKCVGTAVKTWKFPNFSGPNMPIDFPVRIR